VLAVRTLGRVRARDSSCPDARSRVRSDSAGNFLSSFLHNQWNELIRTCNQNSVHKIVCLNTKFLAIIDLGSKTYTYKRDLRPAQQEEEAGLAQGKLRRQLRTGRALLALGLRGGRVPAQAAVWSIQLVLNVPVTGHSALWRRRQAPLVPTHSKVRCGGCESCSVHVQWQSLRTVVPWSTLF
jgi:hypothetical protein